MIDWKWITLRTTRSLAEIVCRFSRGLVLLIIVSPLVFEAQDTSPNSIASSGSIVPARIPVKKPAEILQFASANNGVDVPSAKPWHVKLKYEQFDEKGAEVHSGSIDEYYVAPKRYRLSFAADDLKQTDVATETGLYRTGDQRWPDMVELQVMDEALRPFYRLDLHGRCTWSLKDPCTRPDKVNWRVGDLKLHCIIIDRTDERISDSALPKYCFENDTVPLRYTRGRGWDETIYNKFIVFQDRYVALEILVTRLGKPFLKIHIQLLESLTRTDDALLTHTGGSSGPLGGRITLSSDILKDRYLLHEEWPLFGPHDIGKVTVRFVVGKDGRVIEAQALDGLEQLRGASADAMRKWQFLPYLVLGEPVEVESQTVFEFNTGSGVRFVGRWPPSNLR
jgi:TonB-like protein